MINKSIEFKGTKRFKILRHLGAGGMGSVFEVLDRQSRSIMALKTLRFLSGTALYRFKQEFRSLAGIRHPNLVELYELVFEDGLWFFTMELVRGVDFQKWVLDNKRPQEDPSQKKITSKNIELICQHQEASAWLSYDTQRLRNALGQLACGIHALHKAGKVHRDIKPSNVMVTPKGRVVLLDFGLVREVADSSVSNESGIAGTISYMAPEQASSITALPASDWYSMGTLLYEVLTGKLPFEGDSLQVLLDKQASDPPSPITMNPQVDQDLNDLCTSLLCRKPADRISAREIFQKLGVDPDDPKTTQEAQAPALTSSDLFVGRDDELGLLRTCWERTLDGQRMIVGVSGSSGIGKTALVRRFLEELDPPAVSAKRSNAKGGTASAEEEPSARHEWSGPIRLMGRCYERETVPYKAFDAVVDELSVHLTKIAADDLTYALPDEILYLVSIFPVLRRIKAINKPMYHRPEIPNPLELRRRAFAVLRTLLHRLASLRPLVLFIDDLQWADEDSLELLLSLAACDPSERNEEPFMHLQMLLLLTYRLEPVAQSQRFKEALSDLGAKETWEHLLLGPLDQEDATLLAGRLLGSTGMSKNEQMAYFTQAISKEAGGSPFFIAELVRYVQLHHSQQGHVRFSQVSVNLDSMLLDRIRMLPGACRKLLELVTVAGDPTPHAVLSAAAELDMSSDEWQNAISTLRFASLIRRHGLKGQDLVEPYHDRIRETILATLKEGEIKEMHASLAAAMEAHPGTGADVLARHWMAAGESRRAKEYIIHAADEASAKLAFERGAQLYRMALDLETSQVQRVSLFKALGSCLANAGRPAESANAYLNAAQGADVATRLEVRNLAAEQQLKGGYIQQGMETIDQVLADVDIKLPRSPNRALLSMLWRRFRLKLRGLGYRERDPSELSRRDMTLLDVLWSVASGLGIVDPIRSSDFQTRLLMLALDRGDVKKIAGALAIEAGHLAALGARQIPKARKIANEAEVLARKANDLRMIAFTLMSKGLIEYFSGNWKSCHDLLVQTESILLDRCHGVAWELSTSRSFICFSLMLQGDVPALTRRVLRHVADAERVGDRYLAANINASTGVFVHLAQDRIHEAERSLSGLLATWPKQSYHIQHYYYLYSFCELQLYQGSPEKAWAKLEEDWPAMNKSLLLRIMIIRVEMARIRGRVALALLERETDPGRRQRLAALVRRCVTLLRKEDMPFCDGWADHLETALAWQSGKASAGQIVSMLDNVIGELEAGNMMLYAAAARRRRAELRLQSYGKDELVETNRWMEEHGVLRPDRMTAVLSPGFSSISTT